MMAVPHAPTELETLLTSQGYPTSFGGWLFKDWTCDDLRRALKNFDRSARPEARKLDLCKQLCDLKSQPLSENEQEVITRIRSGREADRLLQDRCYNQPYKELSRGKKRTYTELDESDEDVKATATSSVTIRTREPGRLLTDYFSQSKKKWTFLPSEFGRLHAKVMDQTRECQACIENKSVPDFPTVPLDAACLHHATTTCSACLRMHIEARSSGTHLDAIPCPEPECMATLSYSQMQMYADPKTFARYDKYLSHQALKEFADYHPCTNPACDSGGFGDAMTTSYMICPDCTTSTCITCYTPWHPDISHEENQERIRQAEQDERAADTKLQSQEKKTKQTLKLKTKICPNDECGVRLWRHGGCDHMTCMYPQSCYFSFLRPRSSGFPLMLRPILTPTVLQAPHADTNSAGSVSQTMMPSANMATTCTS
jgi:IBR domain, a half RING-finger domain